jgi:hypothetical protein
MELFDHLPHNWPEFAGLVAVVAYIMWRDRRADRKLAGVGKRVDGVGRRVDEVHKQTQNNHETNLRDDVDKSISVGESAAASGAVTVRMVEGLRTEVREGFDRVESKIRGVERDIGGIREEMRTERTERIAGDRRRDDSA